jgi:hypothetical protein
MALTILVEDYPETKIEKKRKYIRAFLAALPRKGAGTLL